MEHENELTESCNFFRGQFKFEFDKMNIKLEIDELKTRLKLLVFLVRAL